MLETIETWTWYYDEADDKYWFVTDSSETGGYENKGVISAVTLLEHRADWNPVAFRERMQKAVKPSVFAALVEALEAMINLADDLHDYDELWHTEHLNLSVKEHGEYLVQRYASEDNITKAKAALEAAKGNHDA